MKVLLINPFLPKESIYGKMFMRLGAVMPPLGLTYIAAYLRREGIEVDILDANALTLDMDSILERVSKYNPVIVGITATTAAYPGAAVTARAIKSKNSSIVTVIGGSHMLGMAEETMADSCWDFGVIYEGEQTMLELVKGIESKSGIEDICGLIYNREGKIVKNAPRIPIQDLDTLPLPARDLLPSMKLYKQKAVAYKRLPMTHMFTSRGCPYGCIFCQNVFKRKTRFHSPDYVINEVEELVNKYGIREICINDDTFVLDKERVYDICGKIRKKFPKLIWSCNIRVDLVDKPLLQEMKASGCWLVMPGVESGDQGILKFIKKGTTLEQIQQVCQDAHEIGLMIKTSFILGHPTETAETVEKTIEFARKLPVHYHQFNLLSPLPGTKLWEIADDYGVFDKDAVEMATACIPNFIPHGLTEEFLLKKQKEAHRRVYLTPVMIMRHLKSITSLEDMKRISLGAYSLLMP